MRAEAAVEAHSHALRALERHHLRGEDVRKLTGAAAESERTEPADRAGVTVRDRVGCARQHNAELRRHDMGNALFRIVDIKEPYAVLAAAFAHRLDKSASRWIGVIVATGFRRHRMILHREGQVGPVHLALLLFQLRKGMMGMQFMENVTVDIEKIAAIGTLADTVEIPDFVEQGAGHGGCYLPP